DDPINLFVAKFLGTPPINVFEGRVENEKLYIGNEAVLSAPGVKNCEVYIGVRPEGFVLNENGKLTTKLDRVEVMGRDISVISYHDNAQAAVRSIIGSENRFSVGQGDVKFDLKPFKVDIFDKATEKRIHCELALR
ncbi:MAG: ABC transporter ATP-binding protein, partial [Clostridia bacterium]|nr:ABC transporter ATP-binding protein [Clostridia bacterium]